MLNWNGIKKTIKKIIEKTIPRIKNLLQFASDLILFTTSKFSRFPNFLIKEYSSCLYLFRKMNNVKNRKIPIENFVAEPNPKNNAANRKQRYSFFELFVT